MRKNVCITYHMSKENEVAETCITIPMDAAVADDVLANQENSQYVKEGSSSITPIKQILNGGCLLVEEKRLGDDNEFHCE